MFPYRMPRRDYLDAESKILDPVKEEFIGDAEAKRLRSRAACDWAANHHGAAVLVLQHPIGNLLKRLAGKSLFNRLVFKH